MQTHSTYTDEACRLKELHSLQLLDTNSDSAFDNLAQRASEILDSPIALISFVDKERVWYKSRIGFDAPQAPRRHSFCSQVVEDRAPMVVENATADPRFQNNALVQKPNGIRFYAGIPLTLANGYALGSLGVMDYEAKTLSTKKLYTLKILAGQVLDLIEAQRSLLHLRTQQRRQSDIEKHTHKVSIGVDGLVADITAPTLFEGDCRESQSHWRAAIEGSGDAFWDWDIQNNQVFYCERWQAILGLKNDKSANAPTLWADHLHSHDKGRVLMEMQSHLEGQTHQPASEHRVVCKDRSLKWMHARDLVVHRDECGKPLRIIGIYTDITERKQTEESLLLSKVKQLPTN